MKKDKVIDEHSNIEEENSKDKAQSSPNAEQSNNAQIIMNVIVKKKYKKRRFPDPPKYGKYIMTPIYKNTFYESTECYFTGEILVDFSKINTSYQNMYSPWNQFKNINCSAIDSFNRLLITKFDDKICTLFNQDYIIQKYKNYPNKDVQDLVYCLINLKDLLERLKLKYSVVPLFNNQILVMHHFIIHDCFQKRIYQHYSSLGKNCRFLSRHFGPDLTKNKIQFYQQVCSESLSELLGLSIEENQSQQHRLGIFDFFDFETIAMIQRQLMKSILNRFSANSVVPEEFIEYTQPMNLKFITYDEITFYADITIQTFSQKQFNPELKIYSIYFAILFILNVSPTMEQSLRLQRKQLQEMDINQHKQGDITYIIQSEIFKEKFLFNSADANGGVYNQSNEDKVCGYRDISNQ